MLKNLISNLLILLIILLLTIAKILIVIGLRNQMIIIIIELIVNIFMYIMVMISLMIKSFSYSLQHKIQQFVLILFINVNNFVVIFQDQYQSILVSFVMMIISLPNKSLLYISIIYQHFINYLLIPSELIVDILLMDNTHESNSTLFLMMLLLISHLSNLKQNQILLQIIIT